MKFDFGATLPNLSELGAQVKSAAAKFEELYVQPTPTITGAWYYAPDASHPLVTLTLRDSITGKSRTVQFAPNELISPETCYPRVHNAIGAVLHPEG